MNALYAGAGIAAAAGLLLGAAAKPDLRGDDRPEGPQILAGWAGVRSTGPFDDGRTFTAYGNHLPDYVLGTDWQKATVLPPLSAEQPVREARNDEPPPEPVVLTHATYEEPPHEAPSYPSLDGGALPAPDDDGETPAAG